MARLTFLGDVFLHRPVRIVASLGDRVIINLEAPLTRGGEPASGKINLRADPDNFVATFTNMPVAACLANNHVMDFGADALEQTLELLDAAGVAAFGAGDLADGCRNPVVLDVGGVRVGLSGYVCASASPVVAGDGRPGAAPLELERIVADMADARRQGAERVVVQLHWGAEQVALPKPSDVGTARAIVDAGADLVVGHHAHCIQAYERYRGKHVFYGLGNAIFPEHASPSYFGPEGQPRKVHRSRSFPWNKRSLAVHWDPRTCDVEVAPLWFDGVSLRPGTFRPGRYRTGVDVERRYEARYRRAFRWGKLRHELASYLAEPKLPRARHIGALLRLFRSGDAS